MAIRASPVTPPFQDSEPRLIETDEFLRDARLTDRQRLRLRELSEMLQVRGCGIALSEDGMKVLFYGRTRELICSSPLSEFDY